MNAKILASLLALGTVASGMLLDIQPSSAENGSENGFISPVVIPIKGGSGNGSENGFISPTVLPVAITTQSLASVNTVLTQILTANPQALASVTSPAALIPDGVPSGSTSAAELSTAATDLSSAVAGLNPGSITGAQLNAVINTYNNTYLPKLIAAVGGDKAVAFLRSSVDVKGTDGKSTSAPNLRSQLLKLVGAAKSK
jgi:hypothetical protein